MQQLEGLLPRMEVTVVLAVDPLVEVLDLLLDNTRVTREMHGH